MTISRGRRRTGKAGTHNSKVESEQREKFEMAASHDSALTEAASVSRGVFLLPSSARSILRPPFPFLTSSG